MLTVSIVRIRCRLDQVSLVYLSSDGNCQVFLYLALPFSLDPNFLILPFAKE